MEGCCDHRAIPADEDLHRHAAEDLAQADALLSSRLGEGLRPRREVTVGLLGQTANRKRITDYKRYITKTLLAGRLKKKNLLQGVVIRRHGNLPIPIKHPNTAKCVSEHF